MSTHKTQGSGTNDETDSLFATRGLTKKFGGLIAVNDVNLAIEKGEIRCLIGPNGAGKSTLLKLIVGQHEPTAGQIFYQGEDITKLSQHERARRGLSMKFQVPAVYDDLSVHQNMHIPTQRMVNRPDIDTAIDRTLREFDLLKEAQTTADELSHGQQQWLEIAMAAALEPDLLLLDEPAAGMSVNEAQRTADIIHQLNETREMTLLVVEHDMDFVREVSELVTVLHQGEVFAEGTIDEIQANEDVRRIYLGEDR